MLALVVASVLAHSAGVSAVNPSTGELLRAESLLSSDNVRRLLVEMPKTVTSFPPLGLVLVVMLGAAVAERSGFFAASIGRLVKKAPTSLLIPATFAVALLSHHAADAAYVVLIPLAAIVFSQSGRHPLLGVAVAYAGISGAFAANLVPGQFDALILGITHSAALMIDPNHQMNPLGNWWFTASLGALLFIIAWPVAAWIVEPYTRRWSIDGVATESAHTDLIDPRSQTRGLLRAALAGATVVAVFAALAINPSFSPLVDPDAVGSGRLLPLYQALIAGFMIFFIAVGWAYGSAVGTVKSHRDIVKMMGYGLRDLTPYLVLAFFASHFIALFSWSNLGPILVIAMIFDFLIGSSSAKWSAMAPIVVPMLMLLGISPEMTTAAYRMGDSIVNIITPIASNFVLVLVICQRWVKDFGVGSLIALMLPFSIAFGIAGFILVAIWVALGLPPGPDVSAFYTVGPP
jgi:aminobenzoyl-glutamate transport protein